MGIMEVSEDAQLAPRLVYEAYHINVITDVACVWAIPLRSCLKSQVEQSSVEVGSSSLGQAPKEGIKRVPSVLRQKTVKIPACSHLGGAAVSIAVATPRQKQVFDVPVLARTRTEVNPRGLSANLFSVHSQ